jgi:hypothetical protein
LPPPGWYLETVVLNYRSDTLKDGDGNTISSIEVGEQTIDLDVDISAFVVSPAFYWITEFRILGSYLGFALAPALQNTDVEASLAAAGRGVEAEEGNFGFGDLLIQPLYLGWNFAHADLTFGYLLTAPTGKYTKGDPDNIGLGYWSHTVQASALVYPWTHQATALLLATTYEVQTEKEDEDLTPGARFALEWGVSQYLSETFEIGLAGHGLWQVSDDDGEDAINPDVHDKGHALGGQLGYWPLPLKLNVALRYMLEYGVEDRFEGDLGTLTVTYIF